MPTGQPDEPAGGAGVKSARRAIELIEALANERDWLSRSDLHESTGIPRSSLHGLLWTLQEAGWVESDSTGSMHRLGVRALTVGTSYLDHDPAVPYMTRAVEAIRARCGFTTHYARRFGADVVYLETRESHNSVRLVSRVGRTLPAHATSLGKALLADLSADEIATVLPAKLAALTENTITDRAALIKQCNLVRERGYATETEESGPGVRCVAAVIPYRIPATDAISCSIPIDDATDDQLREVGELLLEQTAELGRTLRTNGIR